jgi:hypothetical protein
MYPTGFSVLGFLRARLPFVAFWPAKNRQSINRNGSNLRVGSIRRSANPILGYLGPVFPDNPPERANLIEQCTLGVSVLGTLGGIFI